jgi:putative selenate reductase molybdopterin-binding subunit
MRIELEINGKRDTVDCDSKKRLLDVIREDLGLTGTKYCCGSGECGACTILFDGKPVTSCIMIAGQANGHRIETIEGIRDKKEFGRIEQAFIANGALQCGYCTPAFVLYAYYILDIVKNKKRNLTRAEIRREISGVYCRCGSYQKIIDALESIMKEERIDLTSTGESDVVGKAVERKDFREKIEGRAVYAYDIKPRIKGRNDVLYLKFLRSPHAFAEIKSIDVSRVEGVELVLTNENVPDVYFTTAGQSYPEASPYDTKVLNNPVRYVGEPVAIVAAKSEKVAEEAIRQISVEYDVIKPVLNPEESLKNETRIHPKGNIVGEIHRSIGDLESGFREADVIIDKTYETQMQKHVHLEPYASFSYWDKDVLTVETGSQVVYHCRRTIARILDLPENKIRVLSHTMGGGFGDRQEMTLEHYVSLVTFLTGKPCSASLNREEQFFISRRRHNAKIRIKIGAKKSGELTAVSMEALSDTGAYGSHGVTVTTNMGSMTLPLYTRHCKNIGFDARIVYTNKPIAGAFRGYGTTQGGFALESAMDELAEALGVDPVELRLNNVIEQGAVDPISEILGEGGEAVARRMESCGIEEALKKGRDLFEWDRKKSEGKAIGVACGMKGSGVGGFEFANATAKLNEDGSVTVAVGAADIGQGAESAMAQIAAQASGISFKDINVISADTERSPFDMGTYASSVTYVTGMAVKRAAEDLREKILHRYERLYDKRPELKDSILGEKPLKDFAMESFYGNDREELSGRGSATDMTSPPPFAAHFVELDVNKGTGEVRIVKYLAMSDIGEVINPIAAEGQIQGAILQGIGYALFEDMLLDESGKLLNPDLTNYKIPSALDAPDIENHFIETYEPSGPFGAKSCGEIAFVPVAPAVANAIYRATGMRFRKLPITREKIALRES